MTSITDLSTLQYRVAQRSDDIVHERTSHTYVARWCRPNTQTMLTGNNYLRDSHLKGPNIQPVGNMALPRLPTHQHTHCLICTLPTQHPPCLSHWQRRANDGSGWGELLEWPAETIAISDGHGPVPQCRSHAHVASGQQRYADRKSFIRVSPRSSTKDPHPQTLAICNLESAVRPHMNATLYSYYRHVW